MSKASRYRVNAVVCVLAFVYALYWFAAEKTDATPGWRSVLMGALVVVGIGGAAWFFRRARGATH